MKKLRVLLAFLACLTAAAAIAAGQSVDIENISRNAILDLSRNVSWGVSARGGIENAFLYTPVSPSESFCLAITNLNPTNGHTFTVTVATTTDQTVHSYLLSPGSARWAPVSTVTGATVAANTTYYGFYRINGAARVAVRITGTSVQAGSPDTANLLIGQSTMLDTGGTACGPTSSPAIFNPVIYNGGTYDAQFACTHETFINFSAVTDVVLISGVMGTTTRICHIDFLMDAPAATTIRDGTGATCGTSTGILAGPYPTTFQGINNDFGVNSTMNGTGTGKDLCLHFGAAVGGGGLVTYAQF